MRLRDRSARAQGVTRAVVFDLWDTVAAWPHGDPIHAEVVDALGLSTAEWAAVDHRNRRWTGSFPDYLDWLGVQADAAAHALELRTELTRRSLVPIDGALPLLEELRARGLRLGLISNCSSEVGELWEDSPFAGRFDAVILSADVGLSKPDARIYRLALERLATGAPDAIFVGDGESDELAGAEAAGLRAVQVGSREGWHGERIDSLEELVELL
jgi:putative hydrolase of the HAD superfamily